MRIITIVTSLVSLSFGFVSWRLFLEKEKSENWEWNIIHTAADMLWNLIFITARVITLALFASYEPYWFWGFIVAQIVVVTIIVFFIGLRSEYNSHSLPYHFLTSCFTGFGMVFNMFFAHPAPVKFRIYVLYWILMFIEDTVMISLWFVWTSDLGLWYHYVAIECIIPAHVLALIIKSVQCYFYNDCEVSFDGKGKFYDPTFY